MMPVAFSAKITIIIIIILFPCSGEHVRWGLDARGGKKTTNRHTHTSGTTTVTTIIKIIISLTLICIIYTE